MKNFRKVITLLLAVLVLLSFAACSKDKGPGETNGGNNQDSVNTSSEIYEFKVNLFGETYTLPAELEVLKTMAGHMPTTTIRKTRMLMLTGMQPVMSLRMERELH